MNNRTIYHLEYAKNWDTAASGGEICMLENIKYFISRWEKNVLLTTEKWKKAFENWWLVESELMQYNTIDTEDPSSPVKLLLNYVKRVILVKKKLKNLVINNNDIIFCHSDFFPNSIPFYWLAKKNKSASLFAYLHMIYPSIWKWYEGEFIWKISCPTFWRIYLKLSQIFYLNLLKYINRTTALGVNPYYEIYLKDFFWSKFTNTRLYFLKIFGGVSIPTLENKNIKIYDAVWMGRFHVQKWIQELFDIVLRLKAVKDDAKIVIIGWWSKMVEDEFMENVKKFNLSNNIIYKWFLNGNERFEILSQAKVFLMTSYFEGRPIVMIEVMKLWLPIVAYNLPTYWVYDKWIIKVPLLDNERFSLEALSLLTDNNLYETLRQEALDFSQNYSWENTGKEIYNLF